MRERGALPARHPEVSALRDLGRRRRSRRESGRYLVEGPKLVVEALADGAALVAVYVDVDSQDLRDRVEPAAREAGLPVHLVAAGALAKVTDAVTPQPVVAVAEGRPTVLGDRPGADLSGLVLVLDGVADPGNAGALVRTAEAAGASGVVFVTGSVDPLSPKTVRAAAGSAWRVPLYEAPDLGAAVEALRAAGSRLVGTSAAGGRPYDGGALSGDVALVLGSEAHGLDPEALGVLDEVVSVPLAGRVESLNVSVAGALLCFEWARTRTLPDPGTV